MNLDLIEDIEIVIITLKGGNIDYNNYKVDWDSYVDSMISLKNDKLEILSLKKKNID